MLCDTCAWNLVHLNHTKRSADTALAKLEEQSLAAMRNSRTESELSGDRSTPPGRLIPDFLAT